MIPIRIRFVGLWWINNTLFRAHLLLLFYEKEKSLCVTLAGHRAAILFKNSYHDFFGITTFDHKAGKLKEFLKKVGIIFCNRHQFLVFETDNISLKVGITFFSECVKSAILLKNEFSHFAFLNKSSIFNGLSKRLSRLFTAIASLEKFINGRKVTHIITTFFRGNGANTTFLIKSHDTKKVGITTIEQNRCAMACQGYV